MIIVILHHLFNRALTSAYMFLPRLKFAATEYGRLKFLLYLAALACSACALVRTTLRTRCRPLPCCHVVRKSEKQLVKGHRRYKANNDEGWYIGAQRVVVSTVGFRGLSVSLLQRYSYLHFCACVIYRYCRLPCTKSKRR